METRLCRFCGEEIRGKRGDALYCSSTCKAKHWEQKQEMNSGSELQHQSKDVTQQLRGVLNGENGSNRESRPQLQLTKLIRTFVPARNELLTPIENEIRRLNSVRKLLKGEIEKLKVEISDITEKNSSAWILALTGAGALIGHNASEEKTSGTVIGGTIGLISGFLMKKLTSEHRAKVKNEKKEELLAKIRKCHRDISVIEQRIESLNNKISTIPLLAKKEILLPVSEEIIKEVEENSTPSLNKKTPEFASRLHPDVCQTNTNLSDKVINSMELQQMEFSVLDFRDRWQYFFGYPSVDFHCIIHGMPGEGKSTFAIQFAKYLAENIGRVVYISGEEGFTKTLRDKFMNNNGISGYLDIADLRTGEDILATIPPDEYNFIFIDSLDNMRIDAEKMNKIRDQYKNSALITISQSTKDGKIRGSNELVHDCDISVKVENGIAKTTKNRFKEKGMTYEVFNQQGF